MHHLRRRTLLAIPGVHYGPARRDAPTDTPADGTTGGGTDSGTGSTGDTTSATDAVDWEAKYRDMAKHSRTWETRAKENSSAAEQLAAMRKALGADNDPATINDRLSKAEQSAQSYADRAGAAEVELVVYKTALAAGANADRLLDSRTFVDAVDDLEPEDAADFVKQVKALVDGHIAKDPTLKAGTAGPGPARMGAEHTGGATSGQRPKSLGAAVDQHYKR